MQHYLTLILIIDHTPSLNPSDPSNKIYFEFKGSWRKYMNSDPNILALFICIDESLQIGEYRLQPEINTIYVHGKDSLQLGILQKTLYSLKYLKNHYTFDFILRTNLSCFFDFHKLKKHILDQPKNNIFAGYIIFNSMINGGMQLISSNLVDKIVYNIDNIINSYTGSEDAAISNFVNNISPMRQITNMFYFTNNTAPPYYSEFTTVDDLDLIINRSDVEDYFYYRVKDANNKLDRSDDLLVHDRLYNYYYNHH